MKIRIKLIVAFLGFFVLSLIFVSTFSFYASESALNTQVLNQLESVASIQHNRVASIIDQHLERLSLVSSRTQLRLSLANHIAQPDAAQQEKMNRILDDALSSIDSFHKIYITTVNGKIVAATDRGRIGGIFGQKTIQNGARANAVDQIFLDADNRPALYLAGPLLLNNKLLGVIVIESNIDNINDSVHDYSGLGATGETLLATTDEQGNALHITPLRFDQQAANRRVTPKSNIKSPVIQAFSKRPMLLTDGIDYRGHAVLAATQYIQKTDWVLVVKMDKDEAFASTNNLRKSLYVIMLICSVIAFTVSFYFSHALSKPVILLTQVAQKISAGNLSLRADVNANDEVGQLAIAFNQMTDNLISINDELEGNNKELRKEIHERINVEQALSVNEKKYRQLVELLEEGIWVVDKESVTAFVNPALCQMLGYSETELIGSSMYDYFDANGIISYKKNSIAKEFKCYDQNDYELRCKDGSTINVTIQTATITDDKGSVSTIASVVDITERIKAKQQLQSHRDNLEELVTQRTVALESANKELESFSYSVSHDLRAPLRAIDGFSQALLDEYGEMFDATASDYLGRVRKASQHMGHLIDDLLTLSRVTRHELQTHSVSLNNLVHNTLEQLQEEQPNRAVKFVCNEIIAADGDEQLLQILIDNLIGNAWKYTGKTENPVIKLETNRCGNNTIYCITDNGVGFDTRYSDKLFKAFQRLHGNNEFPGTGIGLATVQRIINRHGGKVWADSVLNQGAKFYFTLPQGEKFVKGKRA